MPIGGDKAPEKEALEVTQSVQARLFHASSFSFHVMTLAAIVHSFVTCACIFLCDHVADSLFSMKLNEWKVNPTSDEVTGKTLAVYFAPFAIVVMLFTFECGCNDFSPT